LLAGGHLPRRVFGSVMRRIAHLPVPTGLPKFAGSTRQLD